MDRQKEKKEGNKGRKKTGRERKSLHVQHSFCHQGFLGLPLEQAAFFRISAVRGMLRKVTVEGIWSHGNKGKACFQMASILVAVEHPVTTCSKVKDVRFKLAIPGKSHRNGDVNSRVLSRGDQASFLEVLTISKIPIPTVRVFIPTVC